MKVGVSEGVCVKVGVGVGVTLGQTTVQNPLKDIPVYGKFGS